MFKDKRVEKLIELIDINYDLNKKKIDVLREAFILLLEHLNLEVVQTPPMTSGFKIIEKVKPSTSKPSEN